MEVVEPGLADRHDGRMREELDELVDPARFGASRLVRVDPECRRDPLLGLGDRERREARGDPGADRDDPRDADRTGALDEERGGLVAPVEVGVGVDHGVVTRRALTPTGASSRGKSGGAASIPSVSPVRP